MSRLPGDPDGETGDMTDGHVDGVMCFVKPGVVMVEKDTVDEGVLARLDSANREALALATDAKGQNLEIIDLTVDHSGIGDGSDIFCTVTLIFIYQTGLF